MNRQPTRAALAREGEALTASGWRGRWRQAAAVACVMSAVPAGVPGDVVHRRAWPLRCPFPDAVARSPGGSRCAGRPGGTEREAADTVMPGDRTPRWIQSPGIAPCAGRRPTQCLSPGRPLPRSESGRVHCACVSASRWWHYAANGQMMTARRWEGAVTSENTDARRCGPSSASPIERLERVLEHGERRRSSAARLELAEVRHALLAAGQRGRPARADGVTGVASSLSAEHGRAACCATSLERTDAASAWSARCVLTLDVGSRCSSEDNYPARPRTCWPADGCRQPRSTRSTSWTPARAAPGSSVGRGRRAQRVTSPRPRLRGLRRARPSSRLRVGQCRGRLVLIRSRCSSRPSRRVRRRLSGAACRSADEDRATTPTRGCSRCWPGAQGRGDRALPRHQPAHRAAPGRAADGRPARTRGSSSASAAARGPRLGPPRASLPRTGNLSPVRARRRLALRGPAA